MFDVNVKGAVDPAVEQVGRRPGHPGPGGSTAAATNLHYRLAKLRDQGILRGVWLDCGCADGSYTAALAQRGADGVVGVDIDPDRVARARRAHLAAAAPVGFCCAASEALPFPIGSFDGVLMNEVLEHVGDEAATLAEIRRVLRPGGYLALMSPNRWFPFEGHGMRLFGREFPFPVPLLPWLPQRIMLRFMHARNYWPSELAGLVRRAGLEVVAVAPVLPVFEFYPWLPGRVIQAYRAKLPTLERTPLVRRFGVSTFVLGRKAIPMS
jgi:SAM-dependent methyltransferase